ncbi:hypothetical protein AWN76_017220 [Rhodothermaceae bacterium RA]|nr:hypothetical protein AWN76_017220 [Rhodothermaceae bacterium RA]
MKTLMRTHFRRVVGGGLLVMLIAAVAACNTGEALVEPEAELESTELAALAESLTQELALSDEAAQDLRAALATHEDRAREPGFLWYVARDLQQRLTEEQKETLFARLEQRPERPGTRPGMGQRDGRRGGPMGGRFGAGLRGDGPVAEVLATLTDEQKEAMQAVREAYRPRFQELMQQRRAESLTPEAFREQLQALREAMRAEMEAILTPEQKAEMEAARAEARTRAEARREATRAAMVEVLGLTAEQQTAMQALREEMQAERESLREQAQAGTLEADALREALEALRATHDEAMAEILTPEQLEIVKIHRVLAQRQGRRMAGAASQRRGRPGRFGPPGGGAGQ